MSAEKHMDEMRRWQEAVRLAVEPLLSDKPPGIVALRLLFAVKHSDGVVSAGNLGMTIEGEEAAGAALVRNALLLMMDIQGNGTIGKHTVPAKS